MTTENKNAGTQRNQTNQINEGQNKSFHLNEQYKSQFNNGDATPNVQDVNSWICGTTVVIISNFRNGQEGQTIRILGNANTTILHGTLIFTNTGANKAFVANKVYSFTMFNNKWYEAE